jgi:protein AbiQ
MKIIFLSPEFYADFAHCKEILQKQNRPYACLAIKIDGKVFAIPIRHRITHKYAFKTVGDCGLDYTKAVIISKASYISRTPATINQKEYDLIKGTEAMIANGMRRYIALYKKALQYPDAPHYQSILQYSSLGVFAKLLG